MSEQDDERRGEQDGREAARARRRRLGHAGAAAAGTAGGILATGAAGNFDLAGRLSGQQDDGSEIGEDAGGRPDMLDSLDVFEPAIAEPRDETEPASASDQDPSTQDALSFETGVMQWERPESQADDSVDDALDRDELALYVQPQASAADPAAGLDPLPDVLDAGANPIDEEPGAGDGDPEDGSDELL